MWLHSQSELTGILREIIYHEDSQKSMEKEDGKKRILQGFQSGFGVLAVGFFDPQHPKIFLGGDHMTFTLCENRVVNFYSTVTLLARFLGWSTSRPRITAM